MSASVADIQKKLNECDNAITRSYNDYTTAMREFARKASNEMDNKVSMATLLPLVITLIGVILMFTNGFFGGLLVAVAGVWITVKLRGKKKIKADTVKRLVDNLMNVLNRSI